MYKKHNFQSGEPDCKIPFENKNAVEFLTHANKINLLTYEHTYIHTYIYIVLKLS